MAPVAFPVHLLHYSRFLVLHPIRVYARPLIEPGNPLPDILLIYTRITGRTIREFDS